MLKYYSVFDNILFARDDFEAQSLFSAATDTIRHLNFAHSSLSPSLRQSLASQIRDQVDSEKTWHEWKSYEESKRLALGCFMIDAETSLLRPSPSKIPIEEFMECSLPASELLWKADSPQSFFKILQQNNFGSHTPYRIEDMVIGLALAQPVTIPEVKTDPFTVKILLHATARLRLAHSYCQYF